MTLNHTISLLEVRTFRANIVQDLHLEKKNFHCKYAQNQRDFNLQKQRGLSVKRELSVFITIATTALLSTCPADFIEDRDTSHLALLLLPSPGLNCAFLRAAKCSNTKALQSIFLLCPGTGSSNRSFSAAEPTPTSQTMLC